MIYDIWIRFAVLATVAMVACGLICQYPPCLLVKCEIVNPDNCNGTVRMGGGYCGCCMACFTTLGLGEVCNNDKEGVDFQFYPPTALCDKGLYCEYNTSTCENIPGFNFG